MKQATVNAGIGIAIIPPVIVNALNGSGVNAAAKRAQNPHVSKKARTLSMFASEMTFGTK